MSLLADREFRNAAIDHYHELLWHKYVESTFTTVAATHQQCIPVRYANTQSLMLLRPMICTARMYATVLRAASSLSRGLLVAARRLILDPPLRRQLALPVHLEPLLELDMGRAGPSLIARFDGLFDRRGQYKIVEFNTMPGGIHANLELSESFSTLPVARAFARRFPFRYASAFALALQALRRVNDRKMSAAPLTIAIVTKNAQIAPGGSLRFLAYAASRGMRVMMAAPEEFEYCRGRLMLGNAAVDTIALVDWGVVIEPPAHAKSLFKALHAGDVAVLNGLAYGILCGYKHLFELLSDPVYSYLFDTETIRAAKRCVPWTRVLRDVKTSYRDQKIDLPSFVSKHRERFVLKPGGGGGGAGIVFGALCRCADWDAMLHRFSRTHIVQERVDAEYAAFAVSRDGELSLEQLTADCAPFVWNGVWSGGCLSRAAPGSVTNVSTGGAHTGMWILGT